VLTLPPPLTSLSCIINLLSLPFTTTHLLIWHIRASGWP
jgi:hypothetical protein